MQAAHAEEKDRLRAQIAELEARIADPEPALKTANERITDLEARLTREGNDLGADKLGAARAALETGDYTAADDLFAEIEARAMPAVGSAARAAFARGEIAEAEVRWADAATHYARAAGLEPSLVALREAADYAERAGDYPAALGYGEQAVKLARAGDSQIELYGVLNEHAITLNATGRYDEAEPLYREAQGITEATLGTDNPAYATCLNNLAGLLHATDRFDEAEPLYREAIRIGEATLGKDHPDYEPASTTWPGCFGPPVALTKQSRSIARPSRSTRQRWARTILTYATRLNNLAVLYANKQQWDEALPMMKQTLAIRIAALGDQHPDTEGSRQSLAAMQAAAGRG